MINRSVIISFSVFCLCIISYCITKHFQKKRLVRKEIVYVNPTASEVEMVWGINYLQLPPQKYFPENSYLKEGMVYTKPRKVNDSFFVEITLPYNTYLNYWMVQLKDIKGNDTEIWNTGNIDKPYFSLKFSGEELLRPGYFIFLAGFIPLVIFYFRNRKKAEKKHHQKYKIKDYIPQFDTLRAIAVLLVICHHWVFESKNLGPLGVNIFFVLSGFLITGILFKAKKQSENTGLKKSLVFKNFYIRRTLRIFPIYYLVMIIFWLINDPELRQHGIYYFTYTSNILFYLQQDFPARVAHLWSLAVEEQFYILWPWLIVLVNKKFLPYLITLFIIIGISSHYIFEAPDFWADIFTLSCFDAFAIGAFLSYLVIYRQDIIEKVQPKFKFIVTGIVLLFCLDVFYVSFLPTRTGHALFAALLIYYCLFKNNNQVVNYVLNNKWLIKIGKISYGIYLYHLFVPELWGWINKQFLLRGVDFFFNNAMPQMYKSVWLFIQEFAFLLGLCIVSWKLIEKPVNKLKNKFEYKKILPIQKAEPDVFSY